MDAQHGIARRMVIGLPAEGLTAAWEKDFAMFAPAGVILFARDFRDLAGLRMLIARLRELAKPRRLFVSLDEEGGWVSQLAGHMVVPPNAGLLARGATDEDLEWIGQVTARRLRALGFDWVFAPVADVASEPANPVIGPRAYGNTPADVARRAGAMVRGLRAGGVASCLKHFPGHGDTRVDSHLALPTCDVDGATLEARELAPFRALLEADAVMTAHVIYTALDPAQPGTFSGAIVRDLLRGRLGFQGVAITDSLEMAGASNGRTFGEAGRLALEAGCDLLLYAKWSEDVRRARLDMARAIVDGSLDRVAFDEARPRLATFDETLPEPTAAELAQPLESLTPADWVPRLERIIERGLVQEGTLPAQAATGNWRLVESPTFAHGKSFAEDLTAARIPLADASPTAQLIAICSRVPLGVEAITELRRRAAELPTILVGLQNDAFLSKVPAAVRLSASDATPLTRRMVARKLASLRG